MNTFGFFFLGFLNLFIFSFHCGTWYKVLSKHFTCNHNLKRTKYYAYLFFSCRWLDKKITLCNVSLQPDAWSSAQRLDTGGKETARLSEDIWVISPPGLVSNIQT